MRHPSNASKEQFYLLNTPHFYYW